MNLSNFDQQVDTIIVDRGFHYFLDGFVDEPQQGEQGIWNLRVYGTHTYHVQIIINSEKNDEVKGWNCDCPYDYGPVCKHVIAALYMLRDDEKPVSTSPGKQQGKASPAKKRQKI